MGFFGYRSSKEKNNPWKEYKKGRCETCGTPINPGFKKCFRHQFGPAVTPTFNPLAKAKSPLDKRRTIS